MVVGIHFKIYYEGFVVVDKNNKCIWLKMDEGRARSYDKESWFSVLFKATLQKMVPKAWAAATATALQVCECREGGERSNGSLLAQKQM